MYGLVLEGGGAKGSYHVGAYKAIMEKEIKIGAVTGTSIGALNGAMIAQNQFDKLYDMWFNIANSQIFDVDDEILDELKKYQINQSNLGYLFKKSKDILLNRGVDTKAIRKIIQEKVDEEKLRNSDIMFGLVTVSLSDMKPLELFIDEIPEGKVNDFLMASANFPAFKLEKMDGKVYVDGGVYDNLPINLMLRKGFKKIIAVRTNGIGFEQKLNETDAEIIYIKPNENLGNTLDFDKTVARRNIKLGYYDTIKVLDNLKGTSYYIDNKENECYFNNLFLQLDKEKTYKIGKVFGLEGIPHKRMIFEFIIPRITEMFNIAKDKDYEDIGIELCEYLADQYEMERFKIYKLEDFIEEILKIYGEKKFKYKDNIPYFIKSNSLLSRAVKNDLLREVFSVLMEESA
ncbi:patatin-like phospholipase family protein [Clostridium sp. DL1XJH146]